MIDKETRPKLSETNKDGSAQELETAEQHLTQIAFSQLSPPQQDILQSTIVNRITRALQAVIDAELEPISTDRLSQNKHQDCDSFKEADEDISTDTNREAKRIHIVPDSKEVNAQSWHSEKVLQALYAQSQHFEKVLQALYAQSQRSEALHSTMKHLALQLETYHKQTVIAQKSSRDSAGGQQRIHEPSRQPTTYIVPQRVRSPRLDRLIAFIPFLMLMAAFAISLAAAVTLAMPSLWNSMSPFFVIFIRGFFLTIAVSIVVSLVLEISRYHRP